MFINLHPRKTKPEYLEFPCSVCKLYEETEAELDPLTKGLLGSPQMRQHFNRCKYHPLLSDPSDKGKCPFAHLLGETIIVLKCDNCGKEFEQISATDPRLPEMMKDPFRIDLCPLCRKIEDGKLDVETPHLIILTNTNESGSTVEKK